MIKATETARAGTFQQLRSGAGKVNIWLPGLLAFALPLSTSAISILAILVLLFWLIEGDFADKAAEIFSNPVVISVFCFLALLTLGLLWSPDRAAGLDVLQDRWKIALLPVLLTSISYRRRSVYVYFFLAGLSVAMLFTFLAWFDLFQYADTSPAHLTRKTFHVVYNPLLAFGIYLVLHEAIWGRRKTVCRSALFGLAGVMIFNMFITEGRTGQLVFFVLMALLLFQLFRTNRGRAFIAVCLLLPMLFAAGYLFSPVFKQRLDTACQEVSRFHDNPDTSVGLRLLFWQNSWEIIRHHPWLGVGTGGFKSVYARVNQEKSPHSVATDNPHNQYILVATMLGIPGVLALLAIFAVMFRQAMIMDDHWHRVRVAFPLFFLTIMATESYLKVYETGFFFALFAAVLFKQEKDQRLLSLRSGDKKCWLILSYRANIEGSACSQHIDDRLPFFPEQGIEPVLLTGPVGERSTTWLHFRTCSLAPSGIRFEVRHFLRKHLQTRWQFKVVETIILLPIFPLYLLEKIIINLESEWSWFFLASLRGFFFSSRYKPEVIYSTGGSASAHVAAMLINKWTGIRWLAETQDPLVHDHDWQRSKMVLRIYKVLEKAICRRAHCFIFLVRAAMEHTGQRVEGHCRSGVIYPGSIPSFFQPDLYKRGEYLRFAHFGSLAGTRNLVVFFQALQQVLTSGKLKREQVRIDVYGSFDGESEHEMKRLQMEDLVICHGPIARKEALRVMQQVDCLLLIQNVIFFSCETIPSKVYEYLLSGRPIIGLLYHNEELEAMLSESGHFTASADDVQSVATAIGQVVNASEIIDFSVNRATNTWTVAGAVRQLVQFAGKTDGC
jgi:O-antigen ligase